MSHATANAGISENHLPRHTSGRHESNYRLLRVICWIVALTLGAAQAWTTRFTMNPDGVSYLDIGDAYWRGDWHNAINAYWSPLYSWILGFCMKVLKPTPYWEYPAAHLVNLLIYAAALACFEVFLVGFIRLQQAHATELTREIEIGIPAWCWWVLAYSLFVFSSLVLIGLHLVTPDLCVSGCVYLVAALILKFRNGSDSRKTHLALGIALGLGYLAKAAMFPLGIVFLVTAFLVSRRIKQFARGTGLATITFLVIGSPLIAALSHKQGGLTFGNVGKIAYEVYVDGVDQFIPTGSSLTHPVHKIFDQPATYEFSEPIRGTYPLWYDPDYWHAGLKPFFRFSAELAAIRTSLLLSLFLFGSVSFQLVLTTGLLVLYLIAPRPSLCFKRAMAGWHLAVPAIAAFVMYAAVYFEYRYVAPFVCIGWLVLFSGVKLPQSRIVVHVIVLSAAVQQTAAGAAAVRRVITGPYVQTPVYSSAAHRMGQYGLASGDKIALVSEQPWGDGGPFVIRLARMRAVAQVNKPSDFWHTSPEIQSRLLETIKRSGVKAVLTRIDSPAPPLGWQQLDGTNYFLLTLNSESH